MLRTPHRLPQRFNRPVTPQTRRLVHKRMHRRRDVLRKRVQRTVQRWQRQADSLRRSLVEFLLFAVSATLVVGVGFFLFSSALHVKEVRVLLTDPRIDGPTIQRGLTPVFGRHLFFLSLQEASRWTREVVPDAEQVTVLKQYPSTLIIELTMDPIIARLSIDDPNAVTGTGAVTEEAVRSDFLTARGTYVAYAESQVQSGSGLLHLHVVDWGARPARGEPLLDPDLLTAMGRAETMLREQFDREVTMRTVYLRGREFHLKTPAHTLWFDVRTPVEDHLARYLTFIRTQGVDAARNYVDLRLVDKVAFQ